MIVIHGATGHVGAELLEQLASSSHAVRALSRRPQQQDRNNVSWVVADADSGASLEAAFHGAKRAFLMNAEPIQADVPPTQVPRLVDAAVRAGVEGLVLLSVFSGGEGNDVIAAFWRHVEGAVTHSGVPWTILRPGRFMSNALQWQAMIARGDEVHIPFAHRKIASIDPSDIAAVAAAALSGDEHLGKIYQLTGPQSLTAAEELHAIGHRLGRPLRAVEPPPEAVRAGMAKHGLSGPVLEAVMARTLSEDGSVPLPTVQQVLGRAPHSFAHWLDAHIESFRATQSRP
jgi:uncharacterized protein YbjT (DUF2867 family)